MICSNIFTIHSVFELVLSFARSRVLYFPSRTEAPRRVVLVEGLTLDRRPSLGPKRIGALHVT